MTLSLVDSSAGAGPGLGGVGLVINYVIRIMLN